MHYRKDTNCISLTSNANIAVDYGRGSYKDKYIMVKIPKRELGEKAVNAGQYMLKELYQRIEQALESIPAEKKKEVLALFDEIEKTDNNKDLKEIITPKYTATKAPLSSPANVTAACIVSRNFAGFSRRSTAFCARRSPSSAICFIFVSFIEITEISALEKIAFNVINIICNTIIPTIFSKKILHVCSIYS